MKKGFIIAGIALGCSIIGAMGGVVIYSNSLNGGLGSRQAETTEVNGAFKQPKMTPALFSSSSGAPDFVEAAEKSINGVVNIRSEATVSRRQSSRFFDPFEFFFGIPGGQGESDEAPTQVGFGSGVIISTDGYIITNNHVVSGASKLTVSTNDNKEYEAKIIGTDPATDLALLKIDATGLYPIPFGDSEAVRVGEWVLAIGNPFNLQSTVTAGIVSAKGREAVQQGDIRISSFIQHDAAVNPGNSGGALVNTKGELIGINTMIYSQTGNYAGIVSAKGREAVQQGDIRISSFIQHDAAVNPGNSGGALVNTKGELIGINTMIYSQTGNYAGYSFAIPVSIASKIVTDLKQYGVVQRAQLGVIGGNINSQIAKQYDLKVTEGAFIADFSSTSAAKKAGLKVGDVITAINGVNIRSMAELQEQVSKYNPGNEVKITVDRKGTQHTFKIVLKNSEGTTGIVAQSSFASLGASFKAIDEKTANKLGLNNGVIVTGVDRQGKFAEAGITKGFIILEINNQPIRSEKEVESITQAILNRGEDKVLFIKGMLPNGRIRYIAVEL
ncbi:trypsin-like peptidase domain-containing protein [uncultured Porphyromonas sp.]|uniref:trypsin-like peptidase domain-containing protein n=1 Tax=uncultured Porphyromonas sp. TaxID=159274 RepID=UPI00260F07A5|nr:trypsin-like peptidase domain-containing protein [uncultured Porphyromonas sp.]